MSFFAWVVVTTIGKIVMKLCPSMATLIGSFIGFEDRGIVTGTLASGAQAFVGNVAEDSAIALLQSAAMSPTSTQRFVKNFVPPIAIMLCVFILAMILR